LSLSSYKRSLQSQGKLRAVLPVVLSQQVRQSDTFAKRGSSGNSIIRFQLTFITTRHRSNLCH